MKHPYPNKDCRLHSIHGFTRESELSHQILDVHAVGKKAILMLELEGYPGFVHGQSNFHVIDGDNYDWKFIRSLTELEDDNVLARLQRDMGHKLDKIYFIDPMLKSKFEKNEATRKFASIFVLVRT